MRFGRALSIVGWVLFATVLPVYASDGNACRTETVISWYGRTDIQAGKRAKEGALDGAFEPADYNQPRSIVVGENANVFVGDSVNYRVIAFGPTGKLIRIIELQKANRSEEPALGWVISALGFDRSNNLYVKNESNDRVEVYSHAGTFLRMFSTKGTGAATGIFTDKSDNVYLFYQERLVAVHSASGARIAVATQVGDESWRKANLFGYTGYRVEFQHKRKSDQQKRGGWYATLKLSGSTLMTCGPVDIDWVAMTQAGYFVDQSGVLYFFKDSTLDVARMSFFADPSKARIK